MATCSNGIIYSNVRDDRRVASNQLLQQRLYVQQQQLLQQQWQVQQRRLQTRSGTSTNVVAHALKKPAERAEGGRAGATMLEGTAVLTGARQVDTMRGRRPARAHTFTLLQPQQPDYSQRQQQLHQQYQQTQHETKRQTPMESSSWVSWMQRWFSGASPTPQKKPPQSTRTEDVSTTASVSTQSFSTYSNNDCRVRPAPFYHRTGKTTAAVAAPPPAAFGYVVNEYYRRTAAAAHQQAQLTGRSGTAPIYLSPAAGADELWRSGTPVYKSTVPAAAAAFEPSSYRDIQLQQQRAYEQHRQQQQILLQMWLGQHQRKCKEALSSNSLPGQHPTPMTCVSTAVAPTTQNKEKVQVYQQQLSGQQESAKGTAGVNSFAEPTEAHEIEAIERNQRVAAISTTESARSSSKEAPGAINADKEQQKEKKKSLTEEEDVEQEIMEFGRAYPEGVLKKCKKILEADENTGAEEERVVQMLLIHEKPDIYILPHLLTSHQCDHLINRCTSRWQRSRVSTGQANGKPQEYRSSESATRTSQSVRLQPGETPIVAAVETIAAAFAAMQIDHLEPLAVVKYEEGESFQQHHDGAFRPVTLLIYLSDVEEGGETEFPYLNIRITPKKGWGLLWRNSRCQGDSNTLDPRVLHSALPLKRGKKYAVNCFFNEKPIRRLLAAKSKVEKAATTHECLPAIVAPAAAAFSVASAAASSPPCSSTARAIACAAVAGSSQTPLHDASAPTTATEGRAALFASAFNTTYSADARTAPPASSVSASAASTSKNCLQAGRDHSAPKRVQTAAAKAYERQLTSDAPFSTAPCFPNSGLVSSHHQLLPRGNSQWQLQQQYLQQGGRLYDDRAVLGSSSGENGWRHACDANASYRQIASAAINGTDLQNTAIRMTRQQQAASLQHAALSKVPVFNSSAPPAYTTRAAAETRHTRAAHSRATNSYFNETEMASFAPPYTCVGGNVQLQSPNMLPEWIARSQNPNGTTKSTLTAMGKFPHLAATESEALKRDYGRTANAVPPFLASAPAFMMLFNADGVPQMKPLTKKQVDEGVGRYLIHEAMSSFRK